MSRTLAIAGRELRCFLLTPTGPIIAALFLFAAGLVFRFGVLGEGQLASLRSVFGAGAWLLACIAPALAMRLFSEEYRLRTWELLRSCPVREREIVLGKFLGAYGLLLLMLAPTLVYAFALEAHGRPDWGEIGCGYLGLALAGAAYLAGGLLASALTSSQPVALLTAGFFWLTVLLGCKLLPAHLGDGGRQVVFAIDPHLRLVDFTIGLLDTSNVVYFLALTVAFLAATIAALQARRAA